MDEIKYLGINEEEIAQLYEELAFFSLLKNFTRDELKVVEHEYKEINDKLGKFGQIETSFIVTSFINNLGINLTKETEK